MKRIAGGVRAERRGELIAASGYFSTAQRASEIEGRRRSDDDRDGPSTAAAREPSADGEG
jgi:hypothetical protein